MKKRLTTYFFLIAALGIALASIFGVWSYREREVASARQTLSELLALMDAQDYYTDAEGWTEQLRVAAPEVLWSLVWSPLVWLLFRAVYRRVGGTRLA